MKNNKGDKIMKNKTKVIITVASVTGLACGTLAFIAGMKTARKLAFVKMMAKKRASKKQEEEKKHETENIECGGCSGKMKCSECKDSKDIAEEAEDAIVDFEEATGMQRRVINKDVSDDAREYHNGDRIIVICNMENGKSLIKLNGSGPYEVETKFIEENSDKVNDWID